MSATKVRYGKPAKLLVDAKGFADGRLVLFEIWKQTGQKKEKVAEVHGVTKREKGVGQWEPAFKLAPKLGIQKNATQSQKDEYSFIAKIDDKTVQGGSIEFTFPLELYLQDENGQSMDGVKFTITFSDGGQKKEVFRNGRAKFEEAPAGKFTIDLEGYVFVFK